MQQRVRVTLSLFDAAVDHVTLGGCQSLTDAPDKKKGVRGGCSRTSFCSLWMSAAASDAERVSSSMLATTLPSRSSLSSGVTCARARGGASGSPWRAEGRIGAGLLRSVAERCAECQACVTLCLPVVAVPRKHGMYNSTAGRTSARRAVTGCSVTRDPVGIPGLQRKRDCSACAPVPDVWLIVNIPTHKRHRTRATGGPAGSAPWLPAPP